MFLFTLRSHNSVPNIPTQLCLDGTKEQYREADKGEYFQASGIVKDLGGMRNSSGSRMIQTMLNAL